MSADCSLRLLPRLDPGDLSFFNLRRRAHSHGLFAIDHHHPRPTAGGAAHAAPLDDDDVYDRHAVTAVDYFDDEHDGLRARKFYSTSWQAVQMDLMDLQTLGEPFDMIILNRCVQFFPQPAAYVAQAKEQLAPGGLLILTGLELFRDPSAKAARVAQLLHSHRQRYGFELFLRPTKGYLDFADKAQLEAQGVQLKSPWQLLPANLKALLRPALPRHCYGVYRDA